MIETDIPAALVSLFGTRVYPDTAPQNAVRPFCTYVQVGGQAPNSLCGGAKKRNGRIQFNVWAESRLDANDLMRRAEDILTAAPLRGIALGALLARWDPMTRCYGAQQDFSLWWVD